MLGDAYPELDALLAASDVTRRIVLRTPYWFRGLVRDAALACQEA